MKRLNKDHYQAIIDIKDGADITGYSLAKRLREIERFSPDYIKICEVQGDYDGAGQLPYFGAIALPFGIARAEAYFKRKSARRVKS